MPVPNEPPSKVCIPERMLEAVARCSLMTIPVAPPPLEACAFSTMQWLLKRETQNNRPELPAVRGYFIDHWKLLWGEKDKNTAAYWVGPNAAARVAKRAHDLVTNYRILRAELPYTLDEEAFMIPRPDNPCPSVEGYYAIVRKPSEGARAWVLNYRLSTPRLWAGKPEIVSLARYVHAYSEHHELDLGIYHLPLLHGDPWRQSNVIISLARCWLRSIIDTIHGHKQWERYPSPGAHCQQCVLKSCLEVFDGPSQGSR